MSVFISRTSSDPYDLVETMIPDTQAVTLYDTQGADILTVQSKLYLVVSGEDRSIIEMRVENETLTGISTYISLADLLDNPLGWSKKIRLTNINGSQEDAITPFLVEWRIINNLYLVKVSEANVNVNVYGG